MKAFAALIRREYWENRGGFLITPIVVGCIMILATLALYVGLLFAHGADVYVEGEKIVSLSTGVQYFAAESVATRALGLNTFMYGVSSVFFWAMMFVLLFYFLGSLWDDRKDRSILFWKSLPVTDLKTVLSKLTTGVALVPLLFVGGVIATHIVFMLLFTIAAWISGVGAWETFWVPMSPFTVWSNLLVAVFIQGLWMLPVWGWLMLASAIARGFFRPFLVAVMVPLVAGLIDLWFSFFGRWQSVVFEQEFRSTVFPLIAERFAGSALPLIVVDGNESVVHWNNMTRGGDEQSQITIGLTLERLAEPAMWWGILAGAVCIAAAVYLRRFRDHY